MRRRKKFDPGFKVRGYKVILPPGKGKDKNVLEKALEILRKISIDKLKGLKDRK